MKKRLLGVLMLTIVICFVGATSAWARGDELIFSVLPRNSYLETLGKYAGLIGELKKATGKNVVLKQAESFDEFLEWIRNGKVDISYENPAVYALAGKNVQVMATALKGGKDSFRGVIIVRANSSIKKLEDLKGKKVWVISKKSAGGYLSQKMKCLMAGISLEDDADVTESPDNKVDDIIKAVASRTADAGCIREKDLKRIKNMLDNPSDIKVLGFGVDLPQWALSVRAKLSDELKRAIQKRLISLESDSRALKPAGLSGFEKGDDKKYQPLRHLLLDNK
jgi:phosphonate transport system substrate-binding protein